ncbi:pyridoxamine 5'-phosphate oxidase family protein [Anaerosporobacter sp.]|uniref:pyridoxamine 5'-phosphate oxidase family protein n=1 Tax=Anaerosporobacter sp. TaxID=1872529 RepID=UPI0028A284B1|nr:pyridoxamine 5'-phosphate oxidase family protein [Anaerosporobacter sp.]
MQYRMKTHQLSESDTDALLLKCASGTLATINLDGTPYNIPVHYVFLQGAIFIHGLPAGQKISHLKVNPNVCFTVYEMQGLLLDSDEKPCDTNTAYVSAIIQGTAELVSSLNEKQLVLSEIIRKYTPHLAKKVIPLNMLNGTAVVKISVSQKTGKNYS